MPVGKGEMRRTGKRVAILAFGAMLKPALEAGEALDATVANMRFVKPLDVELVKRARASTHELLVTVEEHQVMGGAGSAVCEALAEQRRNRVLLLGLPDRFIDHGDPGRLLASVGLDADGIQKAIRNGNVRVIYSDDKIDPMNARDLQNIPDVQATPDSRKLAIDKVGIKAIRHPMQIKERSGRVQHTIATSTCTWACRTISRARTCRASSRS